MTVVGQGAANSVPIEPRARSGYNSLTFRVCRIYWIIRALQPLTLNRLRAPQTQPPTGRDVDRAL